MPLGINVILAGDLVPRLRSKAVPLALDIIDDARIRICGFRLIERLELPVLAVDAVYLHKHCFALAPDLQTVDGVGFRWIPFEKRSGIVVILELLPDKL